jgi:hypothetical protein
VMTGPPIAVASVPAFVTPVRDPPGGSGPAHRTDEGGGPGSVFAAGVQRPAVSRSGSRKIRRSAEFGLPLELVTALQRGGAVRVGRQFPD